MDAAELARPAEIISEAEFIRRDEELARNEELLEVVLDADESALLPARKSRSLVERYRTSIPSPCCDGGKIWLALNQLTGRIVFRCSHCAVDVGRGMRDTRNEAPHAA